MKFKNLLKSGYTKVSNAFAAKPVSYDKLIASEKFYGNIKYYSQFSAVSLVGAVAGGAIAKLPFVGADVVAGGFGLGGLVAGRMIADKGYEPYAYNIHKYNTQKERYLQEDACYATSELEGDAELGGNFTYFGVTDKNLPGVEYSSNDNYKSQFPCENGEVKIISNTFEYSPLVELTKKGTPKFVAHASDLDQQELMSNFNFVDGERVLRAGYIQDKTVKVLTQDQAYDVLTKDEGKIPNSKTSKIDEAIEVFNNKELTLEEYLEKNELKFSFKQWITTKIGNKVGFFDTEEGVLINHQINLENQYDDLDRIQELYNVFTGNSQQQEEITSVVDDADIIGEESSSSSWTSFLVDAFIPG
ncbi:MAG: hypothetical protein HRU35_07150 [Rickettsiaceae bacterium]|nr:hypothetical protein [Rickettsiaceae bacterium]